MKRIYEAVVNADISLKLKKVEEYEHGDYEEDPPLDIKDYFDYFDENANTFELNLEQIEPSSNKQKITRAEFVEYFTVKTKYNISTCKKHLKDNDDLNIAYSLIQYLKRLKSKKPMYSFHIQLDLMKQQLGLPNDQISTFLVTDIALILKSLLDKTKFIHKLKSLPLQGFEFIQ